MSFLAPLYFLGALAVLGPIVFHLIRQQPRGEFEFSSLMFLDPTPPKLTRRSRLDNWPLLLLRCLAICMLAFAFARPYLPMQESASVQEVRQAIVVLMDTSASMRRPGHWQEALAKANVVIQDAPGDALVSVIGFDSAAKTELSFGESAQMTNVDRGGAARDAISRLTPTWNKTDIGAAVRYAADQVALLDGAVNDSSGGNDDEMNGQVAAGMLNTRVVLISDLQAGAAIDSIQGYKWPERVWLDVELVGDGSGNASLRVVPEAFMRAANAQERSESDESVRVQLTHHGETPESTFTLRFDGQDEDAKTVQVPPGETRYVTVELPTRGSERDDSGGESEAKEESRLCLRLFGDDADFDNAHYIVRGSRDRQSIYFNSAAPPANESPDQKRERLSFYPEKLPWSDTTREIDFQWANGQSLRQILDPDSVPFVMLSSVPTETTAVDSIEKYLDDGGRVLLVLEKELEIDQLAMLGRLLHSPEITTKSESEREYSLISSVDFKDPLIAPLSDPGVSDFSNVRFWEHQKLADVGENVHSILSLDDGSPLLLRRTVGEAASTQGSLFVLTSGWQPSQSQFALSTKFVPIMLGMLGPHRQHTAQVVLVGQEIDETASGEKSTALEPGFVETPNGRVIAINLDPDEGDTTPIDSDRFAQFGVTMSSPELRDADDKAERALRDVEMESRQGWWQWLIVATIGLLAAETLMSGRRTQQAEVST